MAKTSIKQNDIMDCGAAADGAAVVAKTGCGLAVLGAGVVVGALAAYGAYRLVKWLAS